MTEQNDEPVSPNPNQCGGRNQPACPPQPAAEVAGDCLQCTAHAERYKQDGLIWHAEGMPCTAPDVVEMQDPDASND